MACYETPRQRRPCALHRIRRMEGRTWAATSYAVVGPSSVAVGFSSQISKYKFTRNGEVLILSETPRFQNFQNDPSLKSGAQRGLGPNGRAAIFGVSDTRRHFYDPQKLKDILSNVSPRIDARGKKEVPRTTR